MNTTTQRLLLKAVQRFPGLKQRFFNINKGSVRNMIVNRLIFAFSGLQCLCQVIL